MHPSLMTDKHREFRLYLAEAEHRVWHPHSPEAQEKPESFLELVLVLSPLLRSCYERYLHDKGMSVQDFLLLCAKALHFENKLLHDKIDELANSKAAPVVSIDIKQISNEDIERLFKDILK